MITDRTNVDKVRLTETNNNSINFLMLRIRDLLFLLEYLVNKSLI